MREVPSLKARAMADLGTDQLLLDVAEYVVGYRVESAEASVLLATASRR